jgi:hypothetical protein
MAAPSVKAAPTIEVNISPQVTNSPTHDQQLAIEAYWQGVDPLTFLPGSINAADRFARVSFLINAIPRDLDPAISPLLGLEPGFKTSVGRRGLIAWAADRRLLACMWRNKAVADSTPRVSATVVNHPCIVTDRGFCMRPFALILCTFAIAMAFNEKCSSSAGDCK